jgi:hypothetical protein
MLTAATGRQISKEEEDNSLTPSSTIVNQRKAVRPVTRVFQNDDIILNNVTWSIAPE